MSRGRRMLRGLGLGLAALAVLVLLLAALLYLNRRAAAREVLVGWLERRGIEAQVEIERLELDGLTAKVRIGDPRDPDFAAERVEVDYALGLPWSRGGLGVTPSRVRLVRPILRARWDKDGLSLGALDPLIEEFTGQPPRPDSRGPLVVVERGRVNLETAQGRLAATADARIDDGRLITLDAQLPSTTLAGEAVTTRNLTASVQARTVGDRLHLRVDAAAAQAAAPGWSVANGQAALSGEVAYPDMKRRRGDGRAVLDLKLTAEGLTTGQTQMRGLALDGGFDGATAGWIETFRIDGRSRLTARAQAVSGPDVQGAGLTLAAPDAALVVARDTRGMGWSLRGPARLAASRLATDAASAQGLAVQSDDLTMGGRGAAMEMTGPARITATALSASDLRLGQVTGRVMLDARMDGALLIQADGALHAARGAWPLFGPVGVDDPEDLKAMKQALGDFGLSVPAVRLTTGSPGTTVALDRPVELRPRNGGVLRIAAADARPVFAAEPGQAGGGALSLSAERGRGLPELQVAVPDWRLTPGGFQARLDGRAALDFDLFRGVEAQTRGVLTSDGGRLTYAPDDCVAVQVERLELDENDVTDVSGRFCPTEGAPLVLVLDGGWTARGRLAGVDAAAPFLAMRFTEAEGALTASGGASGVSMRAQVDRTRVLDATDPRRFNPMTASGQAQLANERWSGGFDLKSGEHAVGRLTLDHDGTTGQGGVLIETPMLVFVEDALQPGDLSPLVEPFVQSPAVGTAQFTGRLGWTAEGDGESGGRLVVPGLDFVSPAGAVKGLRGEVAFTSLVPLVTAPGQRLTADSLETLTPVTDAEVEFALDKAGITVAAADVHVAGGVVRVEPFTVPLDPTQGFDGVIVLDRVQLGEVLAGSGFGDKAQLDAVVSGRLPFRSEPGGGGVRISGGQLYAVQPGRLSIQREALSGVEAGGGGADVPPNTVQDLAYQAMENLAFDTLTAEVNSQDQGRLGVMFHIKGRHDPPQRQELRLSLAELISREFLKRDLPLPSGTGVDLTLDTTLNADQLFADLIELNRARAGEGQTP